MYIKKFNWEEDEEGWNKFCIENELGWFWHTSYRLRHALDCSFFHKSENHSFYIKEGKESLAIVPLTIDISRNDGSKEANDIIEMNYGGTAVPCPIVKQGLSQSRKEKILEFIFKEIDKIACRNKALRLVMRIPLTLSFCKKYQYQNFLMKYGLNDISLNTTIIDLEQNEKDIWHNMSENHRRSIQKGEAVLKFSLFHQRNITEGAFNLFREFYIKISRKKNYPEERFRLLFFYLKNGMAVIGQAQYLEKIVGYAVAIVYKKDAYYLMGANENNFKPCPVAHAIHWKIINYLKQMGIAHYELGIQQFGPLLYNVPTLKDISISLFKRKFGGVTLPYFMGEKFYSKNYCNYTWDKRLKQYLKFVK